MLTVWCDEHSTFPQWSSCQEPKSLRITRRKTSKKHTWRDILPYCWSTVLKVTKNTGVGEIVRAWKILRRLEDQVSCSDLGGGLEQNRDVDWVKMKEIWIKCGLQLIIMYQHRLCPQDKGTTVIRCSQEKLTFSINWKLFQNLGFFFF